MGTKTSKEASEEKPEFDKKRPSFVITDDEIDYFKTHTNLSRSEIKEIFKQFNKECTNGQLDQHEFNELFKRLNKNGSKSFEDSVKFAFDVFDHDKSGKISFKEFILTYALLQPDNLERKIVNTFNAFDLDHNGYLDIDEIYVVIARIFHLLGGEKRLGTDSLSFSQQCARRLDTNGDGKITKGITYF
jgi:Ca2+-binding EF-hand superfamily protein